MLTLLAAVFLCRIPQARADDNASVEVASRWLGAARTQDTKQLRALSGPSLTIHVVGVAVGPRCEQVLEIRSRAAHARAASKLASIFATEAGLEHRPHAASTTACSRDRHRRTSRVEPARGDVDVDFEGGLGTTFTVRVSRDGKVVFVRRSTYYGDL